MFSYSDRLFLYDAPTYRMNDVKRSQTTLSIQIGQLTDVDYGPDENGEQIVAVEKKVYIPYEDTISGPISSDKSFVMKGLVPNQSYIVYGYVKYNPSLFKRR